MRRKLNYWLMAVLIGGLSMSITSCKEDDKELSEEEKQQQAEQQGDQDMADAATFWDVVGQLTDDVMPDDWQNATYEPSIGEADDANTTVRVVATADLATAAERFVQLTGAAVDASTTEYTYQNPLVGSLTYRRTDGQSLATVDVNIKQMPGLSQIIYKSPEQMGDNSSFKGTAYYRFGDVVQKLNADGELDYWICVRPAFGPEGKGDSHWISVSKLPSTYVKPIPKTVNGQRLNHNLPKSLGTNKEHMQNLAEMLYAILEPDIWAINLANAWETLKYFKDFHYQTNYKYNNDGFFFNVQEGMSDYLFEKVFGISKRWMLEELKEHGLKLLYGSASMNGNKVILQMAEYTGRNLKTERLYKDTTVWDNREFDIYSLTEGTYIDDVYLTHDKGPIWVYRYATGATLAKGSAETPASFDKYKRLPNCRDNYVYNADVDNLDLDNLKNIDPRVAEMPFSGIPHYRFGDVWQDQYGHRWFVINQAGSYDTDVMHGEKTSFSELISFEGITVSNDRKKATNLPTRSQAIRGAFFLDRFFKQTTNNYYELEDANAQQNDIHRYFRGAWSNLLQYCNVEIRDLFQKISAKDVSKSRGSRVASIAYDDGSNRQRLLRWIQYINTNGQEEWYLADNYVKAPDAKTEIYPMSSYSDTPIYLQDVANRQMVSLYAEDSYARQGLEAADNLTNDADTSQRQPRLGTDDRVNDVRNCFYYRTAWQYRNFVSDMWNEPVIMFRMTRVRDRGDWEYSDTTVDGLKLTKIAEFNWNDQDYYIYKNWYTDYIWSLCYDSDMQSTLNWHLNGNYFDFPTWRTAW